MKKLYVILYVIILIVICSFAYAIADPDVCYTFETAPELNITDSCGDIDGIGISDVGRVKGKNNFGFNFTLLAEQSFISLLPQLLDNRENFTIAFWYNATSIATGGTDNFLLYGRGGGGADTGIKITEEDGTTVGMYTNNDVAFPDGNKSLVGAWHLYVIERNASDNGDVVFYFNGSQVTRNARSSFDTTNALTIGAFLVDGGSIDRFADGIFDELYIWNHSIGATGVAELWNNKVGLFCSGDPCTFAVAAPGAPTTPTIIIPSPADNSNNNTNVTLNVTHDTVNNDVRYYLYFGTGSTLTESDLIFTNVTRNVTEHSEWTTGVADGTFFWKFRVQNISGDGIFSANTTQRTLIIDTVIPTVTFNANNFFKTDNSTQITSYFDNATLDLSFFDINLGGGQTLINITNSSGQSKFSIHNTSISGTTANYSQIINISTWTIGNKTITIAMGDSHTGNTIEQYGVKEGFTYLEYDTTEGIKIRITTLESMLGVQSISTTKLEDRYKFNFNFWTDKTSTTFRLTSTRKLIYLKDSSYNGHFVTFSGKGISGNWIDFESIGLTKGNYEITKVDDFTYDITIKGINQDNFEFESIGGLNTVENDYRFELTAVVNITAYNPVTNRTIPFTSVFNGVTKQSGPSNSTLHVNISKGVQSITLNASGFDDKIIDIDITSPFNNFTINMAVTNTVDDCTLFSEKIITFFGKDEETDEPVNMTLDITIDHASSTNLSDIRNISFEFRNSVNYSICTSENQSFQIDSIMGYGDGTLFTKRKYYLNNLTVNTSDLSKVFLYHLNDTKASEITFTVFDLTTGEKVPGAFIKILRFYPGENIFRVVEIEKTDEVGETLGKMVLADVFYKFIIEKPAGIVKLDTGVLRVLSLTRSFGISFVTDVLDTWDKIHGVSVSTTCTKGTQTCRFTWSDSSNIVQDATLEVWRTNGITNVLLSSQTTTASAGTISYTIVESTSGRAYTAKSFIESNTGTSTYGAGIASLIFSDNPFFTNSTHRIASLFPLFLLVVVIIFALIDFGVVGVVIGSLLGLIIGSVIGILPISPFYLISFILMSIILIYKLSK